MWVCFFHRTAVLVKVVGMCGVMGVCFSLLQSLIEEQQSQLNQYESAAGQCVSELQKAQLQVQSLQSKIQDSETSNKVLNSVPNTVLRPQLQCTLTQIMQI